MATPNSRSEQETARAVIQAVGSVEMVAVVHRLKVHRDASREGLTAAELEPDGKAAAEIAGLWDWVSAQLQLCTNVNVPNRKAS
jgi:chromosome partitioning protein